MKNVHRRAFIFFRFCSSKEGKPLLPPSTCLPTTCRSMIRSRRRLCSTYVTSLFFLSRPKRARTEKTERASNERKERTRKASKVLIALLAHLLLDLLSPSLSLSLSLSLSTTLGLFDPHQQRPSLFFFPGRDSRGVRLRELRPGV